MSFCADSQIVLRNVYDLMKQLKICDKAQKMIIIKAGASWCKPCRDITPVFRSLGEKWEQRAPCVFLEFNVDDGLPLTNYFNVRQIPLFVCLLPQRLPGVTYNDLRHVGGDEEELQHWLENIMNKWSEVFAFPPIKDPPPQKKKHWGLFTKKKSNPDTVYKPKYLPKKYGESGSESGSRTSPGQQSNTQRLPSTEEDTSQSFNIIGRISSQSTLCSPSHHPLPTFDAAAAPASSDRQVYTVSSLHFDTERDALLLASQPRTVCSA